MKALQSKLSEVTETAIQQGERLRDVRRTKRELDQENSTLTGNLSKAEVGLVRGGGVISVKTHPTGNFLSKPRLLLGMVTTNKCHTMFTWSDLINVAV